MNGQRIDALARLWATGADRRRVVGGLAAVALGGLVSTETAFAIKRKPGGPLDDPDTVHIDCAGGVVACRSGTTCCYGSCVNPFTDERHCGACGTSCSPFEVCRSGECVCQAGHTECAGDCCPPETVCVNGNCQLPLPTAKKRRGRSR